MGGLALVAVGVCQAIVILVCVLNPVVYGCRMASMQLGYVLLARRARGGVEGALAACGRALRRCRGQRGDGDEVPTTPLNHIDSICY